MKNNIIAEFMGMELTNGFIGDTRYSLENPIFNAPKYKYCEPNRMRYKFSWDWLMPVVKKIRQIHNAELTINDYDSSREIVEMINPFDYNLEQVYNACITFIEWYNTVKGYYEEN